MQLFYFFNLLGFSSLAHGPGGFEKHHFSLREMFSGGSGAVRVQTGPLQVTSAGLSPVSLVCNHPQAPITVTFVQKS